jgi:hypothetical protein
MLILYQKTKNATDCSRRSNQNPDTITAWGGLSGNACGITDYRRLGMLSKPVSFELLGGSY